MRNVIAGVFMVLGGAALAAHVTVAPRESTAGASQRYTVRVPTEGQTSTVALELEVPDGVAVTDVPAADGVTVDTRREGSRIVSITWKREIPPRQTADFAFVATNPSASGSVSWKAHQRFADGTSADWIGVAGDPRPASVTRIAAAR